jgi:uncharacterized iron-regulated membrane protein
MTARRFLFWLHLITGSFAGVVILFLAITGTLIAYERPAIAWADRGYTYAPSTGAARQPVGALISSAEAVAHQHATAVAVYSDPAMPVEVSLGREPVRVLLVDAYSATVLGESAPRLRHFFETVTALHRWFGLAGVHRATARVVKGGFTLALIFLIVSGLVLWVPRKWTLQSFRQSLLFRARLKGRARNWNWHNVVGVWVAAPLLVITVTGVVMAYPWANDLLYRIAGSPIPERQADHRQNEPRRGSHNASVGDLDRALIGAEQQVPGWRSATIRPLEPAGSSVTIAVDRGDGGRPDLRSQVVLDRLTNRVLRVESFSSGRSCDYRIHARLRPVCSLSPLSREASDLLEQRRGLLRVDYRFEVIEAELEPGFEVDLWLPVKKTSCF